MADLVIEDIDLELLDQQRLTLAALLMTQKAAGFSRAEKEALEGIQTMLDAWSDKRHWTEQWENDEIQFPRLLAMVWRCLEIGGENQEHLCAAMGVTPRELADLFRRADNAWDQLEEEHNNG